jgi:hypothetical protein
MTVLDEIRRSRHVSLTSYRRDGTVCDMRGRVAPGAASAEGVARLLDEAGTLAARRLLARRYVTSRVGNWVARVLRLRRRPLVAISVTFPSPLS